MAKNQKKFLDASGVTHLAKMLDNYPDNEILGTVIDSIQGELEKKAEKSEIPEVPVQDVQVNGTSVLQDGVANVPVATANSLGVVKPSWGIQVGTAGELSLTFANSAHVKGGADTTRPISAGMSSYATFYGLAKAAGADEKDSTLPVGQYTDTAKAAIRSMIGATSDNVIAVQDTQPTDTDTKIWLPETAETPVEVPTVAEMEQALNGKVDDVQVNGVSVVTNGVANVPKMSNTTFGVAKALDNYGIIMLSSGFLQVFKAVSSEIKAGTNPYRPIVPANQHEATFYGLAKAAGDTTQATSDNAVGTYTSDAQSAIQTMFNVPSRTDTVLDTTLSRGRMNGSTVGEGSYAFGSGVTASGSYSHAEGGGTSATNSCAHAEGGSTKATGAVSHAEGSSTTASGDVSHAEGYNTTASGVESHAEGVGTTASGGQSHAEGTNTTASGDYSHAEGYNATASGDYSHAEGRGTKAIKDNSHAEGGGTTASGVSSHAEGGGSTASGEQSHAEGGGSQAQGKNSHAEGGGTTATGQNAHSEGGGSQATGSSSHAEGQGSKANAEASHAEGNMTEATAFGAHAEGNYTKAKGNSSHAEGYSSIAEGELAHAEGYQTYARGAHSHAEGHNSYGASTQTYSVNGQPYDLIYGASGIGDHSEGYNTVADSSLSITLTDSYGAHAEGVGTIAIANAQHAQGKWNVPDVNLADVVGNGTEETRSNAYALDWSGNGRFAGNVYVGCGTDSSGGTMLPKDVQIDGTSIVNNGVANIPLASANAFGVFKTGTTTGTGLYLNPTSGMLFTSPADTGELKTGTNTNRIVSPSNAYVAAFYGLAKAAGDTTQSTSDNTIGTYTDEAKIAIQKMLGIYEAPWELIREDTFINETEADHVITVDGNGNPFELTDVVLMFETPVGVYSAKGAYGQLRFYKSVDTSSYRAAECGAWTQEADAPRATGITAIIEKQAGGLVKIGQVYKVTSSNSGYFQYRYGQGYDNNTAAQSIFLDPTYVVKKIVIPAVTGNGHYKLYGKRKWQ